MRLTRLMTGIALATSLAVTAGCSNQEDGLTVVTASKLLVSSVRNKPQRPDAGRMARVRSRALERTDDDQALMSLAMPSVKAESVFVIIESNGDHDTWAVWGRTDRRTVTTKRGIITATRAVPPDLMSASVDEVLTLVENREEGSALYTQRYLDGNHKIVEAKYACTVTRGYDKFVDYGAIQAPVVQMFSSCFSADRQFVDQFLVTDRGRIVQSRQWVGPVLGFAIMQRLR